MDVAALLVVLAEVRALLARPGNDYSWSSFGDTNAALQEFDGIVAEIQATGQAPWTPVWIEPTAHDRLRTLRCLPVR